MMGPCRTCKHLGQDGDLCDLDKTTTYGGRGHCGGYMPKHKRRATMRRAWAFVKDGGVSLIVMLASLAVLAVHGCHVHRINKACDTACAKKGYLAGEQVPHMKHDACVCWPSYPGPGIYFLFERN
jgi:hypothetical protein